MNIMTTNDNVPHIAIVRGEPQALNSLWQFGSQEVELEISLYRTVQAYFDVLNS